VLPIIDRHVAAATVDGKVARHREGIDRDRYNRQHHVRMAEADRRRRHACNRKTLSRPSARQRQAMPQDGPAVVAGVAVVHIAIRAPARMLSAQKSQLLERPDKSVSICPRKTIWYSGRART
jgi:hypothetical protein